MDESAKVDDAESQFLVRIFLLYRSALGAPVTGREIYVQKRLRFLRLLMQLPLVNALVSNAEQAVLEIEISVVSLLRRDVHVGLQLGARPSSAENDRHIESSKNFLSHQKNVPRLCAPRHWPILRTDATSSRLIALDAYVLPCPYFSIVVEGSARKIQSFDNRGWRLQGHLLDQFSRA